MEERGEEVTRQWGDRRSLGRVQVGHAHFCSIWKDELYKIDDTDSFPSGYSTLQARIRENGANLLRSCTVINVLSDLSFRFIMDVLLFNFI